jgi:ankyrin repeat protein
MRFAATFLFTILTFVSCDSRGTTASQVRFALACARGDTNVVKDLLATGQININAVNGKIGPCLVSSAYGGHREIIEILLDKGADINVRDEKGGTPLVNAVVGNQTEVVKLLLERGADPNIVVPNENGEMTDINAVKIARIKGHAEIIKLLENAIGHRENK